MVALVSVRLRWSFCVFLLSAGPVIERCCGGGVPGLVFEVGCLLAVASLVIPVGDGFDFLVAMWY